MSHKINDIEIILQRLLDYFDLDNMSQLADKLSVSQPTISKWKSRGSILPIKKICRELGIYNEIFGDLKLSTNEEQSNQELNNDIFSDDILKTLDIIRTMVKNNQEIDNKLNETLKSFIKENL